MSKTFSSLVIVHIDLSVLVVTLQCANGELCSGDKLLDALHDSVVSPLGLGQ